LSQWKEKIYTTDCVASAFFDDKITKINSSLQLYNNREYNLLFSTVVS